MKINEYYSDGGYFTVFLNIDDTKSSDIKILNISEKLLDSYDDNITLQNFLKYSKNKNIRIYNRNRGEIIGL